MHVLFDTNIVLDVLLNRQPWVVDSQALWQACDDGQIVGYMTASSFTDIFYIARRLTNRQQAQSAVELCLEAFVVLPVDRPALIQAVALTGQDFEDNLQVSCALLSNLESIVTRNVTDFAWVTAVQIYTPLDLLETINHVS